MAHEHDLSCSLQQADARHRAHLDRRFVLRCLRAALSCDAQVTVRIVDEVEGRQLNRDYRGRDYATNVLTFDYTQHPMLLADLVLCAPVVEQEARAHGLSLRDHYAHLLVHGALHAQGWDHEEPAEACDMECLEIHVLAGLGVADPYGHTRSRRAAASQA